MTDANIEAATDAEVTATELTMIVEKPWHIYVRVIRHREDAFNFSERALRDRAESGLASYTVPAHEGSCLAFVLLNDWPQNYVTYARLEAGDWVPRTAMEIIDMHDPKGIPRREAARQARATEKGPATRNRESSVPKGVLARPNPGPVQTLEGRPGRLGRRRASDGENRVVAVCPSRRDRSRPPHPRDAVTPCRHASRLWLA